MEREFDSLGLTAFLTVCTTKNFTRAAELLYITQSALSQRILRFEETLGTTLIQREALNFSLTDAGQQVLSYGRQKKALLDELIFKLKKAQNKLSVRIGAFSSVLRSVIIPSLSDFFRTYNYIEVEYFAREIYELPNMLMEEKIDIAILPFELNDSKIFHMHLFDEQNILIESSNYPSLDIYLDHDEKDQTTYNFLHAHGIATDTLKRCFYDDIYGIIDGVSLGLGRAVVPLHLIKNYSGIRRVENYDPIKSPVFLNTLHTTKNNDLYQNIITVLKDKIPAQIAQQA